MSIEKISIRARVAFGILCLENTVLFYNKVFLDWSFVYKVLWSFMKGKVGDWHYPMAEISPRSVLFDATYAEKEMEFLTEEEYNNLREVYSNSNTVINSIINLIFEIGTRDLYSSIVNESQDTIKYLQEIIHLLEENNIPLPDIKLFETYTINENDGWGREFGRDDILGNEEQ